MIFLYWCMIRITSMLKKTQTMSKHQKSRKHQETKTDTGSECQKKNFHRDCKIWL